MGSGLGWRLRAISNSDPAPKGKIEDIMSAPVKAARPETHLSQIVPFMADAGLHHCRWWMGVWLACVMAAMFAVATDDAKEKAPAAPLQIKSEAAAGR